MAGTERPAKAQLIELDAQFNPKGGGKKVDVQFNPETLKVSYANQIAQPSNAGASASSASGAGGGNGAGGAPSGDQSHQASRQFVGAGTTKLALQLWFDVNAPLPGNKSGVIDVRELTKDVAYFITPKSESGETPAPPAVRFVWGSFSFDGMVDSLEESLEYFSDEGLPLRASMSLNLSQQKIVPFEGRRGANASPPGVGAAPGTRPLLQAAAGVSLQGLADAQGQADWQSIAAANGIENPRLLQPGQLIDIHLRR